MIPIILKSDAYFTHKQIIKYTTMFTFLLRNRHSSTLFIMF